MRASLYCITLLHYMHNIELQYTKIFNRRKFTYDTQLACNTYTWLIILVYK